MLPTLGKFLAYHNAVPLTVAMVLVGASSTYAMNNPELVYDANTTVASIDNTYIATVDMDTFMPYTEITDVQEDDEYYYVSYTVNTIELVDAVWQDTTLEKTLQVRKSRLGEYLDLGLYVTEQLKQVIDGELARLRETQKYEQRQITQKQQVTTYSGLIGGRLDPTVETLPGYKPRVQPPKPEREPDRLARPGPDSTVSGPNSTPPPATPQAAAVATAEISNTGAEAVPATTSNTTSSTGTTSDTATSGNNSDSSSAGGGTASGEGSTSDSTSIADSSATDTATSTNQDPYLQLLGAADIEVLVGATYTDLGVATIDVANQQPTVKRYVDDEPVPSIILDTTAPREYTITYRLAVEATEYDSVERVVRVVEAQDQADNGTTTSTTTAATTTTSNTSTTTATSSATTTTNQNTESEPEPDTPASDGAESNPDSMTDTERTTTTTTETEAEAKTITSSPAEETTTAEPEPATTDTTDSSTTAEPATSKQPVATSTS